MNQTAEAVGVGRAEVSSTKFHPLFGKDLAVALESTLDVESDNLEIDAKLYGGNVNLIFRNGDCWRVYYPAITTGDITQDAEAQITFLPWFSGPEVMYNRLTLRVRPITGRVFRWMALARFGEQKPFGFDPAKPFINLDFFSKRNSEFLPLYVKVKTESGDILYLVLEGSWSEAGVTLNIRRVTEGEAPAHLVGARP